jgi:PBP1b-binding outer membrane lipoprotein LpoB
MNRYSLILGAALLWAGTAQAQDKTFTLTVNARDLQVISAGLDELPRKVSQPIVEKFQQELLPQMKPVEAKPAEKTGATPDVSGKPPVPATKPQEN